jgi:hypothetical protein
MPACAGPRPSYGRANPGLGDYTVPNQVAGMPPAMYGQPCQYFANAAAYNSLTYGPTPGLGGAVLCAPPLMRDRRVWTLHGVCDHACRWAHDPYQYRTARAHQNLHAAGGGR